MACDGAGACVSVPLVNSFASSATTLPGGGGAVTLSWSADWATSYSITSDQGHSLSGLTGTSQSVTVARRTTFTLHAENATGVDDEATLTIDVSPNGSVSDIRQFGPASGSASLTKVAAGSDDLGFAVIGTVAGTLSEIAVSDGAFVVKYPAPTITIGAPSWGYEFPVDVMDSVADVAMSPDGRVYVVGTDSDSTATGSGHNGGYDAVLAVFQANGMNEGALGPSAVRYIGTSGDEFGSAVSLAPDGSVFAVGGTTLAKFDAAGTPGWEIELDETNCDVTIDSRGYLTVYGQTSQQFEATDPGGSLPFLAQYTAAGAATPVWRLKATTGWSLNTTYGVGVLQDDSLAYCVTTWGQMDPYDSGTQVTRVTSDGTRSWTREEGDLAQRDDWFFDLTTNRLNDIYVVGKMRSSSSDGDEMLVAKYDRSGNNSSGFEGAVWLNTFGSSENDQLNGVAVTPAGYLIGVGTTYGDLAGGSSSTNSGDAAIVLIR